MCNDEASPSAEASTPVTPSVQSLARSGIREILAKVLEQGLQAGLERDEDEWLAALVQESQLEIADRALRQRIEEDFFGGSIFECGLRPWALQNLRVKNRTSERSGPVDYHDIEISGLGANGETVRATFLQNSSTKEASFRVAIFSNVDPVVDIIKLKTTWACDTHGFEESDFESMEEMHCGQCPDKKHPCVLEIHPPELLIKWLRNAGAYMNEEEDDIASFLFVFTLVDLDMVSSKLANFLFSPTSEHDAEYGSDDEAMEDAEKEVDGEGSEVDENEDDNAEEGEDQEQDEGEDEDKDEDEDEDEDEDDGVEPDEESKETRKPNAKSKRGKEAKSDEVSKRRKSEEA